MANVFASSSLYDTCLGGLSQEHIKETKGNVLVARMSLHAQERKGEMGREEK